MKNMNINLEYLQKNQTSKAEVEEKLEKELSTYKSIRKCKGIKIESDGQWNGIGFYKWYQCVHLNDDLTCKFSAENITCNEAHENKKFLFIPYKLCRYKKWMKIKDSLFERYEKCIQNRNQCLTILEKL